MSTFLPNLLYAFAKNPKIQAKARNEIDMIFSGKDHAFSLSDLHNLKYTSCCIKEALRMFPPIPMTARYTEKPMEIDGKWIPSGMYIRIDIWLLHHNPEIWPDPFSFDPTRFSADNAEKRDPYAFIPFAAGQRKCIAENFAVTTATVFLVRMLKEFEVSLHHDYEMRYDFCLTHSIKAQIPLKFIKRPKAA